MRVGLGHGANLWDVVTHHHVGEGEVRGGTKGKVAHHQPVWGSGRNGGGRKKRKVEVSQSLHPPPQPLLGLPCGTDSPIEYIY
ncbi:hypothetical protein chiPu_0028485 [Chiloscyllium punctatum]|uniref:Uncharacterized protein n=1 Tax=Chiloscyllium punctatum TaxID=137246 RepID=A0A401TQ21_CHIPU|nr:hypothetical protein [Chiloscyllium punctatum]